jgi:uncharacterized membrane protein
MDQARPGFYTLFVVGLIYVAIGPAVREGSLQTAMLNGARYAQLTCATYDLTAYTASSLTASSVPGAAVEVSPHLVSLAMAGEGRRDHASG